MPGENIQDWSTTASSNATADSSINWAEGQTRASVNDSARSMMAAVAKDRNLKNGSITTGGTANAQTFTSGLSYTSIPTGLKVNLKIGTSLTNTASTTLNIDGIGGVLIKDQGGNYLVGGEIQAGAYQDFLYNGTNWILLGSPQVGRIAVRVFTSSSTYPTVTNGGSVQVLVYCKGGGGGGGAGNVGSGSVFGGGGGEGGETWKLTTAAALSGQTVTVGAAGAAVAANTNNTGGTGGTSSIGSIVTAPGGAGGTSISAGGVPGLGGAVGTGDWGMPGAPGTPGCDSSGAGTIGLWGKGGGKGGGTATNNGSANSGGGGGPGGTSYQSGAGGTGIVVCYEFGAIS